jgi:uncharacterized protein YunC (DUF1805 family)
MKELILQRKGQMFVPFDPESAELIKSYYENQLVRAKITGIKKPRSYQQLKAYWKACEIVADHIDKLIDKYDADWQIRVELKHYDHMTVQGDKVYVECKSINYANLDHAEANNFFDRAFALQAKWLGVSKDELLKQTEE